MCVCVPALIFGFSLSFTFALAFECRLALTLSFELSTEIYRCVCGGIGLRVYVR